jgi:diadenosine tetraphosphate (Ap4A) HIT family hydrolase
MVNFELHPDLQRDGIPIGRFPLCQVLLNNDKTYPWFVLVPMIANVRDTIDLTIDDHQTLWNETRAFGIGIMNVFKGDKLNVAALGNVTPQLHIHAIVRYRSDPAWPTPIWGKFPMQAYDSSEIELVRRKLGMADIIGFQFS